MFCPRNFQIGCNWTLYCNYLSHCSEKWFPKVNFQSLYRGFRFVLPITGFICLQKELFWIRKDLFCLPKEMFWIPKDLFCPISGIICLPKKLFCSPNGIEERHMDSTYWSCALNMMMQSSICRQANQIEHSKIGRFLYKYKLVRYIDNCA